MELVVSGLGDLPGAAKQILEFADKERVFLFYGEMGAGKTTLIKALCQELEVEDAVSSPTFAIVNEYSGVNGTVYHFDFYRIKNESEALDLGYEDYLYSGNYCFIEWPEKIQSLLPNEFVELKLQETSVNERVIKAQKVN
ncbi:MAG: tRNA (adenosine(37)-N6)-threonylcarbamoyltransferase complex ATPase subunit type 1 TsaE [Sphingobacteriaceae bacterium]